MTKTATFLLFFFLSFSLISSVSSKSVQDRSWLKVGVYAEYSSSNLLNGRIILANGTKLWFLGLDSPAVLRWEVVKVEGKTVWINLTFCVQGNATIIGMNNSLSEGTIRYFKAILFNTNTETGNTFADGQSIGKTGLWAEVNATEGQKIELFTSPSDEIAGNVTRTVQINLMGRKINSYEVEVYQLNPFVYTNYIFDQQTGIVLKYTVLGPVEIVSNSTHTHTLLNGTTYNVTRYARTRLSEMLGIENEYTLMLTKTNIELGKTEPTNAYLYVGMFLALFVSLATVFIVVDKKHKHNSRYPKHSNRRWRPVRSLHTERG